jgi:hypothetical protein
MIFLKITYICMLQILKNGQVYDYLKTKTGVLFA